MRKRILYILLGATLLLILHNYIEDRRQELQEEIFTLQKRLMKVREARETEIEGKSEEKRKQSLKLFDAPGSTGAISKLQALITDTARASHLEILSVRPSPVIKYTYHEGVVLYVEAKGSAGAAGSFLEKLHSSERAFFIPRISLKQTSDGEEELRLTMEIAGLRSL